MLSNSSDEIWKSASSAKKRLYNWKSGLLEFKIGDSVWRYSPSNAKLKFEKPSEGYLVTAKVNALCYRIQKTPTSRSIVVHVDHIKLYKGIHPVENWLKSNTPDGDSENSNAKLMEIVSEHKSVTMGGTGQLNKNSEVDTSELVNSQHSDLNAVMPYGTTSPSVPSADLYETMPYGMDGQAMANSNLYATMPYGTTSPSVPSADLDETMPYGMDG